MQIPFKAKEPRGPELHMDFLLSLHCVSVMLGNTAVEDTLLLAVGVPCLDALSSLPALAQPHSHSRSTCFELVLLGRSSHTPLPRGRPACSEHCPSTLHVCREPLPGHDCIPVCCPFTCPPAALQAPGREGLCLLVLPCSLSTQHRV